MLSAALLSVLITAQPTKFQELKFELPTSWKLKASPQVAPSDFLTSTWNAPGDKELHITHWAGFPKHDGGAMVIARQWDLFAAGQKTRLIETSFFQGQKSKVLVLFLVRGKGRYRIHTRNVSRRSVLSLASTLAFESVPTPPAER
ncbi:MAG: hypothetical protein H7Z41_02650 [Cytophagales bacterium]|nr:hypothetical protein [Armatimonadota bacterium]